MAVGSFCQFTATVALGQPAADLPSFEDFDPTWTETTDPDGVYSVVSGNIRVADAGRYLVRVSLHYQNTNARWLGGVRCRLNTTVIEKAEGRGNLRNSANSNAFFACEFFVDMAANDDIDIQWGKGETQATGLIAADSTIQLVRITDAANAAYGLYHDGADTLTRNSGTPAPIPFDTIDEETDTAVIQRHATNDDEFLLKGSIGDRFLVLASTVYIGAATRIARVINMTLDGTQIDGNGGLGYLRNADIDEISPQTSMIVIKESNSDETLRVTIASAGASSTAPLRATNLGGLHIWRIPDGAETIVTRDSTGGEAIAGSTALRGIFETEEQRDSASYVITDNDTVTVQKTDTYIMGANIYGSRTNDGSRANYGGKFRINGVDQAAGQHGMYTKNITADGYNLLGIYAITSSQTVEVQNLDLGDNGASSVSTANRTGFWSINAATIEGEKTVFHTTDSILLDIVEITHTTDSFMVEIFTLSGVTRDSNLNTVGNCRVILFKQDNAAQASRLYTIEDHVNSDGSGNFTFNGITDNDAQYMVYAIKLDSPQIRGLSDDDLQPV